MDNRVEKTNEGEDVKVKKVRTTWDDPGGKSVTEKSKSVGEKCVSDNSTRWKRLPPGENCYKNTRAKPSEVEWGKLTGERGEKRV